MLEISEVKISQDTRFIEISKLNHILDTLNWRRMHRS